MKLSFSLPPKPSSKQQTNPKFTTADQEPSKLTNKEYLTEFDASKTPSSAQNQPNKLVIPPIPNEYRPHKKMKNLELPLRPSDRPDLRFELENPSASDAAADGGPHMSYGLNLRDSSAGNNAGKPESVERVMLEKLKEDLSRLPDDNGPNEYTDMPVEGFGAALLAGYGWYEGRGIGRNAKGDVKVVQYEKRTAKEGLGFTSDMLPTNNNSDRKKRGGEEGLGFSVGNVVRIVGGRDVGLKGRVVEVVPGGGFIVVKLLRSEEEVKVRVGDVAELGSVEEERCLRKLKELKIQGSKDEVVSGDGERTKFKDSRKESKGEGVEDRRKDEKRGQEGGRRSERREEMTRTTTQLPWLISHIRVRIISKELKGGRLYLKKGEVVDVVGPTSCDLSMDDSRELIQGVNQDILETVIPRRGGTVVVLYGKHKGAYGNLVERDMDKETGIVRDADTHELLNVRLEQIAEYIGDPSYIGY
ncbi:hypothetical protein RHMOL_Rhmol01G0076900 [Rhododendron molle]|uniref:Uncharacterized protein n=1 Tax=Rhododendron molle TaxID=49168 RepID=A0ACC0Q0X6_RHOML|nr:hypothetical protein RHMOL_Rhmol01G0076900 [Rhododendron molle]